MTVVTKTVVIENETFTLIEDTQNGKHFFGTIPHSELDSKGCLKRALNGFQMCIADSVGEAITARKNELLTAAWKKQNPNATPKEEVQFIMSLFA